jgi:hypothetical protein
MKYKNSLFPDRIQAWGFKTIEQASQAACKKLGTKAKRGQTFIILSQDGKLGWLNVGASEYTNALMVGRQSNP